VIAIPYIKVGAYFVFRYVLQVKTEGYNLENGDEGDRTPDLGVANAALSHLSYIPTRSCFHIKLIKIGQSKIELNRSCQYRRYAHRIHQEHRYGILDGAFAS
jgi:hypothetical protein